MTTLSFAKDIRPLFTDLDVAHMKAAGLDLSDREEVASKADAILETVSSGTMPPPSSGESQWTSAMCETFKQWRDAGCPP
jgi:hypothetical protein